MSWKDLLPFLNTKIPASNCNQIRDIWVLGLEGCQLGVPENESVRVKKPPSPPRRRPPPPIFFLYKNAFLQEHYIPRMPQACVN